MPITEVALSPSVFNTLTTNVAAKYLEDGKPVDVIFKATPALFWARRFALRSEPLPYQLVVKLWHVKPTGGGPFQYYDNVDINSMQGPTAGRTTVANYSWPIALSWQEAMEFTSPEAFGNHLDDMFNAKFLAIYDELAKDFYRGNNSDARRIVGLEQLLFPKAQNGYSSGTISYLTDKWKFRQQTNTYLAVARAAYTADDTTGTGWEAVTAMYNDATGSTSRTANKFQMSSTAPNGPDIGLKMLHATYNACSYGDDRPDVILSTQLPADDYQFAVEGKTQVYMVNGNEFMSGNWSYPAMSYKGVPWFVDEYAKTYNTSSGDANSNFIDNVYMLNSRYLRWNQDSRSDMEVLAPREPMNQHTWVRHVRTRMQSTCVSPRHQGRIFNYPT